MHRICNPGLGTFFSTDPLCIFMEAGLREDERVGKRCDDHIQRLTEVTGRELHRTTITPLAFISFAAGRTRTSSIRPPLILGSIHPLSVLSDSGAESTSRPPSTTCSAFSSLSSTAPIPIPIASTSNAKGAAFTVATKARYSKPKLPKPKIVVVVDFVIVAACSRAQGKNKTKSKKRLSGSRDKMVVSKKDRGWANMSCAQCLRSDYSDYHVGGRRVEARVWQRITVRLSYQVSDPEPMRTIVDPSPRFIAFSGARPCRADLTSPELDTDSEAYIDTTCFQNGSGEQIGSLLQE